MHWKVLNKPRKVLINFVPESRLRVLSWISQWHPLHLPPGCLITLSNCRIQFVSCPQTVASGSGRGLRTRDPPGSDTGITKMFSFPQLYCLRLIDHDTNILTVTQFSNQQYRQNSKIMITTVNTECVKSIYACVLYSWTENLSYVKHDLRYVLELLWAHQAQKVQND
jgi:hypothetical protein